MAAHPRDRLIVVATLVVLGAGLWAVAQTPRRAVVKEQAVEHLEAVAEAAAKPKAKQTPLPAIAKPKAILAPEKRNKGARADKPKRKAKTAAASRDVCAKYTANLSCPEMKRRAARMTCVEQSVAESCARKAPAALARGIACFGLTRPPCI